MEKFVSKVISSAPNPPRLWLRYVDKTFVIHQARHRQPFLQHNNSFDPQIQFTTGVPSSNGSIPFLAILVSQGPNSTLLTSVYWKPIQTDQYLHWDSHHNLAAKYSLFNTLTERVRTVCANKQLLQEEEYIRKAVDRCKGPTWALNRLQTNNSHRHISNEAQNNHNIHQTNNYGNNKNSNIYMVVPHI